MCFSVNIRCFFVFSAFLLTYSGISFAQTAQQKAAERNQEVIQQFEQERLQEQLEETVESEKKALTTDLRQEFEKAEEEGPCVPVDNIVLEGITLFKIEKFDTITTQYKGRCLYLSDINALAQEITNFYIERGYITSRAYIPQQDLSGGTLVLHIVEGHLEKIEYRPSNEEKQRNEMGTAFPGLEEKHLNLRDIEQGLDQINRLRSNEAKLNLSPGQTSGGTILEIDNTISKRWHVKTGVENTGSKATGKWQGLVEFDYDNIFGANDLLHFSFKHDLEQANRRQSRSVSGRYEVPLGYWNLYYALNYFDYISEVSAGLTDFKTTGLSRVHDIGFRRVLHRDQDSKTNISGSLVAKENENFLAGVKLSTSSQKLTIFNLGLYHSRQITNGFVYGALNYSRGTGWLGAQEDSNLSASAPKAEFDRVTADVNAVRIWDIGLGKYNPRTDLTTRGQWSADTLFGSEQISVGGPFSVRGFKESSISGDIGAYGRFEVSVPVTLSDSAWIGANIGRLRPFAGFDAGIIKSDSKNSFEGGAVKSWTLGLKNEGGVFDFECAYSKPVSSPSFTDPESHDFLFQLSIRF